MKAATYVGRSWIVTIMYDVMLSKGELDSYNIAASCPVPGRAE